MDCEFIETQKGGRSTAQWRISERELKEFWRCCLQISVARATTVGDQLEDVRGERRHAQEKV